jgi:four helix bundle protein
MAYPQFENLKVWQKARELAVAITRELKDCKESNLRDQLQRVALSIMNNIAKGYERKGASEFDRFLYIARGYCGEFRSMLYVVEDLGCITNEQRMVLNETCVDISKMLSGLIKRINGQADEKEVADKQEEAAQSI